MSLFASIETDEFYGITLNKGELLVSDGTKNVRLPVGPDGYVLTTDSAEINGVKWAIGGNSPASISADEYSLSNVFSTNSTTPIEVAEFTHVSATGIFLILAEFTFSVSRNGATATVGLYKNGVLNSSRTFLTQPNTRNSGSINFYATANSGDTFNVRLNSSATNSTATLYSGTAIYSQLSDIEYVYDNTLFTTNSTSYLQVSGITSSPNTNTYIILLNVVFGVSRNNRSVDFALFKDSGLIPGTTRNIITTANQRESFSIHAIVGVVAEEINIRVRTSNSDTTVSILDRSLVLIPLQ
jgi:hypothetical protein